MNVELLALDIDGTLLDSRKQISPCTSAALHQARARGVVLVLVTGRPPPAARRIADRLWPDITLVSHNGALVVEAGAVVRARPLPVDAGRDAVALGSALGHDPVLHCGRRGEGRLVVGDVDPANEPLLGYLGRVGGALERVNDVAAGLDAETLEVMFGGRFAQMQQLCGRLEALLEGRARVERTAYRDRDLAILDVVAADAGKADAVAFLCRRLGVSVAATLAIGDNWNDREMLEQAGRGLVMGNAEPELQQLGLEVLPTNDEDGVATALEKYVLNSA